MQRLLNTLADIFLAIFAILLIFYVFSQPSVVVYERPAPSEYLSSSPTSFPLPAPSLNATMPEEGNEGGRDVRKVVFDKVNSERLKAGLKPLKWNSEVAEVAQQYAEELAEENKLLTLKNKPCALPFIHHKDVKGRFQDGRLRAGGVDYFSLSAENLFAISKWKERRGEGNFECLSFNWSEDANVSEELLRRISYINSLPNVSWSYVYWTQEDLVDKIVSGWMGSERHREVILEEDFEESGVGWAEVNDFVFVVQVFIKRAECGYNGGPCCDSKCFEGLSCVDGRCIKE